MDAFAKMDIFFLVTTVAVVVFAICVSVLLFYAIRTARDVSNVVHIIKKESERFAKGTAAARQQMRRGGTDLVQKIIAFVQSFTSSRN